MGYQTTAVESLGFRPSHSILGCRSMAKARYEFLMC